MTTYGIPVLAGRDGLEGRVNTYTTRVNKNGQYIDIVHVNASAGSGCIARIPIRSGFDKEALERARLITNFLNEYQRCLNLKEGM